MTGVFVKCETMAILNRKYAIDRAIKILMEAGYSREKALKIVYRDK